MRRGLVAVGTWPQSLRVALAGVLVAALPLAWGLLDRNGLQASRQQSPSPPRDPAPAARPLHPRPLARLTAHVKNAQAPTLWARAHRLMALGAADAPTDLDFCAGRLRPATRIAPFPHWFDADDDDEALRVDKSESHEGQLLLAFVSQVGTTAPFRRTGESTINTLVRGEQSRHLYSTFIKAINESAPDLATELSEAQREARGSSSPQVHGRVRARQRQLADLDLTWFAEAVALDLAQRGRPIDEVATVARKPPASTTTMTLATTRRSRGCSTRWSWG